MSPVLSPMLRRSLARQSTIITRLEPVPVRTLPQIHQRRHTVNHSTSSVAQGSHTDKGNRDTASQLQRLHDRLDDRLMTKHDLQRRLEKIDAEIRAIPHGMARYELKGRFRSIQKELSKITRWQYRERQARETREAIEREERGKKEAKEKRRGDIMFYSSALLTGILLNRYYGKLTE